MKPKNKQRKLERRMADFAQTMNTRNTEAGGVQQRKETGGFHRPGSNSK